MALKDSFEKLRAGRLSPSISMAPLIDMVFLLLIFYVVTTTFNQEVGVPINKAAAESSVMLDKNQLVIAVDSKGQYWIDGQKLNLAAAAGEAARMTDANLRLQVVVLPDREGKIDPMIRLLDRLRLAKITNFAIGTEKGYGK